MKLLQKVTLWNQTILGRIVFGLLEAALAYLFISLAIDSGSLLDYSIAVTLIILAIIDFVRLYKLWMTK